MLLSYVYPTSVSFAFPIFSFTASRGIQQSILTLLKQVVDVQQRRWSDNDGNLAIVFDDQKSQS